MSFRKMIEGVEKECQFNRELLASELADCDAEIMLCESEYKAIGIYFEQRKARAEQKKIDLAEEFAEREAGLMRLIDGETAAPSKDAANEVIADAA